MSRLRLEMKLGAEPKKVALLAALLATAAYFYYQNFSEPGPSAPSSAQRPRPAAGSGPADNEPVSTGTARAAAGRREFRPSLLPPKDVDRSQIDPTLRVQLLERPRESALRGRRAEPFRVRPCGRAQAEAARSRRSRFGRQAKMVGPEPPPPPPGPAWRNSPRRRSR